MQRTSIGWTDFSCNPIRAKHIETGKSGWACTRISPGCEHCYAESLNKRWGTTLAYDAKGMSLSRIVLVEKELEAITKLKTPSRIFLCDMTDLFHPSVPDEFLMRIWATMRTAYWHTFQLLTKRAENMCEFVQKYSMVYDFQVSHGAYLRDFSHVHLGISAEDQPRLSERYSLLAETPAACRFWSLEPLLGPIDARGEFAYCPEHDFASGFCIGSCPSRRLAVDWIIVGGESGPGYRPMRLEWLESVVNQCRSANIPCFVKQDHGLRPGLHGRIPDELWIQEFPHGAYPPTNQKAGM